MIIRELIYNLSLLITLSVLSGFIDKKFDRHNKSGKIFQGILFGITVIIGMSFPFVLSKGIIFDGRSIVISLSTLFFGPLTGIIASLMAASFRIYLGGAGTIMGLSVILSSFLIGLFFNYLKRKHPVSQISVLNLFLFGLLVHITMLVCVFALPSEDIFIAFRVIVLSVLGIYPFATLLIGKILQSQEENNNYIKHISEAEHRYRIIAENTGDSISIFDLQLNYIYTSPSVSRLLGYTSEEMLNLRLDDLLTKESYQKVYSLFVEHMALEEKGTIDPDKTIILEVDIFKKDKYLINIETVISFIRNDEGRVINFLTISRDITDKKNAERALKASESKFYTLFENSPNAIFISEPHTLKIIDCNTNACLMNGYKKEELVGQTINILHPDEITTKLSDPEYRNYQMELLTRNQSVTIESIHKKKDGTLIPIESSISLIEIDGKIVTMGIDRDISDRKTSEKKLKTLSSAIEQSPVSIVITDILGDIEFVNKKFLELTGYDYFEVIGQNPRILKSGEQSTDFYKGLWDQISKGGLWKGELHNKRKNGELYWEEAVIFPILDADGKIINYVAVKEDVTNRKKILLDLIKSEEKFRSIWQNSVDAMALIDKDGVMINVNEAYCHLFGLKKEQLIGNLFSVSYKLIEGIRNKVNFKEKFLTRSVERNIEGEIQLLDHTQIWVEQTNTFIELQDEEPLLLSIIRNVTERRKLIQELIKSKERAEEINKLKSSFLANMSHELRTPMMGILGNAELINISSENAEIKEMSSAINYSGMRLINTLNLILDLSRIEANKENLEIKKIEVVSIIKDIVAHFHPAAKQKGIDIRINGVLEILYCYLDERLFREILNNLINNAIKFTAEGSVSVSYSVANNTLILIVRDTGIGIPAQSLDLIFQEFRQVSEGYNRSFEGSGLGLTITKKFIEKLGGKISVKSVVNEGSEFIVELPIIEEKPNV